ncbi:Hypothetical predicted protein [Drosophila guanche]|uniref:Uncharacterized protein n=1 Tax=Drosophila guanche TaxID=7266 RepID=A0A3B0KS09_DROGU|nr:Hypothetical predicted protein [Drosophila guanche]
MFTNWLTGSTGQAPRGIGITAPPQLAAPLSGGGGIMSTPPDVILEVGPAPSNVRFVAHALVLGMHSGYLRSAIRMDESAASGVASNSSSVGSTNAQGATGELLLYLGNVTAEQFAPLLTYMYTGYLDLNVDNIFAVLLATHVLHMPRALEICRSFLARAQTEGYLNGSGNPPPQLCPTAPASAKIIRPIPSKATLPNFGFLPVPVPVPVPLPLAPPPPPPAAAAAAVPTPGYAGAASLLHVEPEYAGLNVSVDEDEDEEEDVEVFIDSNTVTDNENEDMETEDCNVSVVSSMASSSAGSLNIERLDAKPTTPAPTPTPTPTPTPIPTPKPQAAPSRTKKEPTAAATALPRGSRSGRTGRRNTASSGLQVAKAPVPAAQLETATAAMPSKFIIDVASCDGPVRFRRILNTAYGHKPEGLDASTEQCEQQRTQQSVSYSFHQQMARAISSQQRQQQQQQQQEESENSGDATGGAAPANNRKQANAGAASTASSSSSSSIGAAAGPQAHSQELYVCVYCKHTFKSQYCYQKHAKRHLNPLSLASAEKKLVATSADHGLLAMESSSSGQDSSQPQEATAAAASTAATTSALMRREVRPLDMNVQYYPCKTCGSKFPSYYFVHKHRKMCHADEIEAAAATSTSTAPGAGAVTGNTAKRETTLEPSEDQQLQQQQQP